MIGIGHSSVGAIIGLSVAYFAPGLPLALKLAIVFVCALLSHYVGDWVPHGHYHARHNLRDFKTMVVIFFDAVVFTFLLLVLAHVEFGYGTTFWLIGIGMLAAIMPDILEGLVYLGVVPNIAPVRAHTYFHLKKMHWHSKPSSAFTRLPRPMQMADMYLAVLVLATLYIIH